MAQLIFQTAFIGDALLSLSLVKSLKSLEPEQSIEIVCRPLVADLYNRLGIAKAHPLDKSNKNSWKKLKQSFQGREFDTIYCPHESFTSAQFVKGIRSARKIGYKNWWNFLHFSDRIDRPMQYPEALRQLALLTVYYPEWKNRFSEIGQKFNNPITQEIYDARKNPLPEWAQMNWSMDSQLVDEYRDKYGLPNTYVCLAPGSVWATKQWGLDKYKGLCKKYVDEGHAVVVTGSPAEAPLCAQVIEGLPNTFNLAGNTDLYEMLHVLKSSRFLVSNDSGTMHLAALAETPTVSIFGPTVLNLGYRPWQSNSIIVQKGLSCRPCGLHGHKACPIGTHECMKNVRVSDVYEASSHFINC